MVSAIFTVRYSIKEKIAADQTNRIQERSIQIFLFTLFHSYSYTLYFCPFTKSFYESPGDVLFYFAGLIIYAM